MSRLNELNEMLSADYIPADTILLAEGEDTESKKIKASTLLSVEQTARINADATLQGNIDTLNSTKQAKTLSTPIEVNEVEQTTVEGTLSAINSETQRIESKFDDAIDEITDGTSIVKKAERDANGNVITDTYFRKDGGTITGDVDIGTSSVNQDLEVHGDATVNGTLQVNGDIVQNGSSYETHAENVYSKDDMIITRDGAVSALGDGDYTGIRAKKYDGTNDGLLAFDKNGEARVGDYSEQDDNTQPLLTRNEKSAMTNKALLVWNATLERAETAPVPATEGRVPVSQADGSFAWQNYSSGGSGAVAHFATMSEYEIAKLIPEGEEGYLPDGALVVIDSEDDVLKGYTYQIVKRYVNGITVLDEDFATSTMPIGKQISEAVAGDYAEYSGSYQKLEQTFSGSSVWSIFNNSSILADYFHSEYPGAGVIYKVPNANFTVKVNGGTYNGAMIRLCREDPITQIQLTDGAVDLENASSSTPISCDSIEVYVTDIKTDQWFKKVTDATTDPETAEYYEVTSFSDEGTLVTDSDLIDALDEEEFKEYTEIATQARG